jgi:hypothetical protein
MILYVLLVPIAALMALSIVWSLGRAGWRVASSRLLGPARRSRRRKELERARLAYEGDDAAFLEDQRSLSRARLAFVDHDLGITPAAWDELKESFGSAAGLGLVALLLCGLLWIVGGLTFAHLFLTTLKVVVGLFALFALFVASRVARHKGAALELEVTLREEQEHMRDVQSMVGALSLAEAPDAAGGLEQVPQPKRRRPRKR